MAGNKLDPSFQDRAKAAAEAKKAMVEKFRASTTAVDPETLARRAAQAAAQEAKAIERKLKAEAAKAAKIAEAEEKRLAEMLAKEEAARKAEEDRLAAIEAAKQLAAEQKAARDLRYAARKARKN